MSNSVSNRYVSAHDPLCPWVGYSVMDCDECDLIAKVRADDRKNNNRRVMYTAGHDDGYKQGRIDAANDINKTDGWNTGCPCGTCGRTVYVLQKEAAEFAARLGVTN